MVKWVLAGILVLPVAEIATFVVVGLLIGFGWAVLLLLAISAAGLVVLRQAGRGRLARFRKAVTAADAASLEANAAGFLDIAAGLLLLLPGFLTGLAGLALLIGPVRTRIAAAVGALVRKADPNQRRVVDLDPAEWRQLPDRDAPQDRHRTDR
jgi:UPF0716 protein FxsA